MKNIYLYIEIINNAFILQTIYLIQIIIIIMCNKNYFYFIFVLPIAVL